MRRRNLRGFGTALILGLALALMTLPSMAAAAAETPKEQPRWMELRPVSYTDVLMVESVDLASDTVCAGVGYLQEPTGQDSYDALVQYCLFGAVNDTPYPMAMDAELYFRNIGADALERLDNQEKIDQKLAEGYFVWQPEIQDGQIVKLTCIPWRQKVVYEILAVEEYTHDRVLLTARACLWMEYPRLENNYRIQDLNQPQERILLTENTEYFYYDWNARDELYWEEVTFARYGRQIAPLVEEKTGNRERLTGEYCQITRAVDGRVISVQKLYRP